MSAVFDELPVLLLLPLFLAQPCQLFAVPCLGGAPKRVLLAPFTCPQAALLPIAGNLKNPDHLVAELTVS